MPKYIVQYTKKDPIEGEEYKTFVEEFPTREVAEKFVELNQSIIYWSSIASSEPKSEKPKILVNVNKEELLKKYDKFEGFLETHFETGMECLGLVLDERIPNGLNPDFNPDWPEDARNFKYFRSHSGLHFIDKQDILQYKDESGNEIKALMIRDSDFAKDDGYALSLYPQGFSREELMKLFVRSNEKAVLYKRKKT